MTGLYSLCLMRDRVQRLDAFGPSAQELRFPSRAGHVSWQGDCSRGGRARRLARDRRGRICWSSRVGLRAGALPRRLGQRPSSRRTPARVLRARQRAAGAPVWGCSWAGSPLSARALAQGRSVLAHVDRTLTMASRSAGVTHSWYFTFTDTTRATYSHR